MTWMSRECLYGLLMLASLSLAGCGDSPTTAPDSPAEQQDHDHQAHGDEHEHAHAHSESFAEALTEVEEFHAAIKAAIGANDLDKADGPIHEVGHVLEELPKLAAKESLPESDLEQVKQTVDTLMDRFGAVDERIHDGDADGAAKLYDEIAEEVDEAIAALKAIELPESQP